MSSKDKENKSVQDKLKQFFRLNKGGAGAARGRGDFSISGEVERDVGVDSPMSTRTRVLRTLSDTVLTNKLEEVGLG